MLLRSYDRMPQKGQIENVFYRKMETPKANCYMIWHNMNLPYTLEKSIQVDMVGQVLSMEYLKKIREEASAAYSWWGLRICKCS